MKKTYELTVLFVPHADGAKVSEMIGAVEKLVKKLKGKVLEMTDEGKQRLAYPVNKNTDGIYVFWRLSMPGAALARFEADLRLQSGVMRQLLVVEDKKKVKKEE